MGTKYIIAITAVLILLLGLFTCTYAQQQPPKMIIVTGQVRGTSTDGKDTVSGEIKVGGFNPGSIAHIFLTGWSFKFTYGDHNILELGLWLQQARLGGAGWEWAHDLTVNPDGSIWARYYAFIGSQNRDNPFTFLVNYAVYGEQK
jgi:hypothetical protein